MIYTGLYVPIDYKTGSVSVIQSIKIKDRVGLKWLKKTKTHE